MLSYFKSSATYFRTVAYTLNRPTFKTCKYPSAARFSTSLRTMAAVKAHVKEFLDKGPSDSSTGTYIVSCPNTKKCAVIDPVWDFNYNNCTFSREDVDRVLGYVREHGLSVEWILETHAHADHITAAQLLKKETGAKVAIGENIRVVQETFKQVFNIQDFTPDGSDFDHLFKDNEIFKIGDVQVKVMNTPGHTPDSVSYYVVDQCIFVGDTMFMPDGGSARCDFPKGNARELYKSCQSILSLPLETVVYCCHDYAPGGRKHELSTTVEKQRQSNIHLKDGITEDDFVKMRETRDKVLNAPRLLLPSVRLNIRAGKIPEPASNGVPYLSLPLKGWKI